MSTHLGAMPTGRRMVTRDLASTAAPVATVFDVVRDVEAWPALLPHYRWVRMVERDGSGGGIVEMSANRPFGPLGWPTFWRSLMEVDHARPAVRFRHIGGVTTGMDVDWAFAPQAVPLGGTDITLLHVWDGPRWPLIGPFAALAVIGPVFVHGIATRTIAGLVRAAERRSPGPAS
ncbi:MAG: SRPBCC family protein [Gemmatimonadota bacterium]|nr:SRPBCC family protein [Gemmatimonadota bacterium]